MGKEAKKAIGPDCRDHAINLSVSDCGVEAMVLGHMTNEARKAQARNNEVLINWIGN